MKSVKTVGLAIGVYLMSMQQAFASHWGGGGDYDPCTYRDCTPNVVPEIDGGGAIIAIGLLAGLVALIREKFYR